MVKEISFALERKCTISHFYVSSGKSASGNFCLALLVSWYCCIVMFYSPLVVYKPTRNMDVYMGMCEANEIEIQKPQKDSMVFFFMLIQVNVTFTWTSPHMKVVDDVPDKKLFTVHSFYFGENSNMLLCTCICLKRPLCCFIFTKGHSSLLGVLKSQELNHQSCWELTYK